MKPAFSCLFRCLALGLLLLVRAAWADPSPDLTAAIAQLDTDLLAIPAGSTVTDAQDQAIVADLTTLSADIAPAPDPADLATVASALEAAAVAGNVTADSLADLDEDLTDDAGDADFWLDDILSDAQTIQHLSDPPDETDPNLPIETVGPVFITAVNSQPRSTGANRIFSLDHQQGMASAGQYYHGQIELITHRTTGSAPTTQLRVRALGLPLEGNPYTVGIVRQSDGAHLNLGQVTVQTVAALDFYRFVPGRTAATDQGLGENLTLGRVRLSDSDFGSVLPEGLNPQDVATVTLTDSQGLTRLSGEYQSASFRNHGRSVALHLSGNPATAPAATGTLTATRLSIGRNFASHLLYLNVRHLPGNTWVTLVTDGVAQGQFTTRQNGRLSVTQGDPSGHVNHAGVLILPQTLPKTVDFSRVKSLTLIDAQGDVLVTSDP